MTFAQAEGVEPLPRQLTKTEMPIRLRSRLWDVIESLLEEATGWHETGFSISEPWHKAIKYYYIEKHNAFGDTFPNDPDKIKIFVRTVLEKGTYIDVFDFLQRILTAGRDQINLWNVLNAIFADELCAYRVYDRNIIAPVASEIDRTTISDAIEQAKIAGATGSRAHLRRAIQLLNLSRFADSVRESINAVESVAKVLSSDSKTELSGALAILEKSSNIHGGMRRAFNALYGYTSDQGGIRHSLLYGSEAEVDEADALFMIGACSAFVTYLINRARNAGISVASTE